MKNVKPLRKFGQNYLKDQNILTKIVEELNPQPADNIIEIGPGTGALTKKLLEAVPSITAVEIDTRVADELAAEFSGLKLIRGDFLKVDLDKIKAEGSKLRIAGNIPYNLTSSIIFRLIENNRLVSDAVLMVQLEVAQRMTAFRGTKDYGILAVLLKYFTDVKIAFKVSPNVFYPKPKVHSAVIHLFFKEIKDESEFQKMYIKIVKACFGNRRKTLKNSLRNSIFAELDFSGSGVDLTLRAERLEIEDFIKLTHFAISGMKNPVTNISNNNSVPDGIN